MVGSLALVGRDGGSGLGIATAGGLVGDVGHEPALAVDGVSHSLDPTVGQKDVVRPGGVRPVPGLILAVVVAGVVVLHGPGEVVPEEAHHSSSLRET